MAEATNRKILLNNKNREKQWHTILGRCCCSLCGNKLRFSGISEYPLTCWQCMILDVDS